MLPLEFKVAFNGRGFRWPLRDGDTIEVWEGTTYCGEFSATIIRQLLTLHLATAQLEAELLHDLAATRGRWTETGWRRDEPRKPPARAAGRGADGRSPRNRI
jgi:hypothetical protein